MIPLITRQYQNRAKHFTLVIITCLLFSPGLLAQTVDWVQYGGGSGSDLASKITKDKNRNYFMTGQIENTATFNLTSVAGGLYVAKYDSNGIQQWVVAQANNHTYGKGICLDKSGNIYVVGWMDSTVMFGNTLLTSLGDFDIILAKYSPGGNLIWVKQFGGAFADKGVEIISDRNDNIFITGYLSATAQIGPFSVTAYNDSSDMFFAKCDTAGNIKWVKTAGGADNDQSYSIAVDSSDNIFVTGTFMLTSNFDNIVKTSAGDVDAFVSKYDSAGVIQWVVTVGDTSQDHGLGICTDAGGNCYVSGNFFGYVSFGFITLTSEGKDLFLASYSPGGNCRWVHQATAPGGDRAAAIAMDDAGRILIGGFFSYDCDFGGISLTSAGDHDIFVARYDSLGTIEALLRAGGIHDDQCYTLVPDIGNGVLVAGLFSNSATFGPFSITSHGAQDAVLVKMKPAEIIITSLSDSVFCPSEQFDVSFTTVGSFTAGNIFSLQLSNSNGDFTSNILLGTLSSTTSGIIHGFIPPFPFAANTYKIRIVSSNPPCIEVYHSQVQIHSNPAITIAGATSLCASDSTLLIASGGNTYSWIPPNYVDNANNDSVYAFPASTTTFSVTGTDVYGCKGSSSQLLTVVALPASLSITAAGSLSFCANSHVNLSATVTPSVTYQWQLDGNNISGASGSTFVANQQGNYTCTVSNACGSTTSNTIPVTVYPLPPVTIASFIPVCVGTPSFPLSGGTPAGGTYSGAYVSSGIFNPSTAGSYLLTYSYTDSNSCSASASTTLQVASLPGVTFNSPQTLFCSSIAAYVLSGGSPAGGNYSGTAVIGGQFFPSLAGLGTFPIGYTYTDINGCSKTDYENFTVDVCTATEPDLLSPAIQLFPNPASNEVRINISSSAENWQAELYNEIGISVGSIQLETIAGNSSTVLDVSRFPRGIYLVIIKNDSHQFYKKLVLE